LISDSLSPLLLPLIWKKKLDGAGGASDLTSAAGGGDQAQEALDAAIVQQLSAQSREAWAPLVALSAFAKSAGSGSLNEGLWCFARDTHVFAAAPFLRVCPAPGDASLDRVPGLREFAATGTCLAFTSRQPSPFSRPRVAPSVIEHNASDVASRRERENEWNTLGLAGGFSSESAYRARKKLLLGRALQSIVRRGNAEGGNNGRRRTHLAQGSVSSSSSSSGGNAETQFSRKVEYTTEGSSSSPSSSSVVDKLTEEEVAQHRSAELSALEDKLANAKSEHDRLAQSTLDAQNRLRFLTAETQNAQAEQIPLLERDYKTRKATLDMLPEADDHMQQLRALANQSREKIRELAGEWEVHRTSLLSEHRGLRSAWLRARGDTARMLREIRLMRGEMASRAQEIKEKDALYRELVAHFREMAARKDRTRGYYTDRILDIVGSVKKQKADIDKILLDTRQLQKEINSTSDTLNRTFGVTDELIFADAKKAQTGKKDSEVALGQDAVRAYKSITTLNDAFKALVHTAEKHGRCANAILDLEARIQNVREKTATLSLESVGEDLAEMRAENARLEKEIRARKLGIEE
jgi:coiled-coil domain-containing protein 22